MKEEIKLSNSEIRFVTILSVSSENIPGLDELPMVETMDYLRALASDIDPIHSYSINIEIHSKLHSKNV